MELNEASPGVSLLQYDKFEHFTHSIAPMKQHKTRSTVKTCSSRGGRGYTQIVRQMKKDGVKTTQYFIVTPSGTQHFASAIQRKSYGEF